MATRSANKLSTNARTKGAMRSLAILCAATTAFPAPAAPWRVTSDISVKGTYTDNVDQAPDGLKRSDFVVNVVPGIQAEGSGRRFAGRASLRVDNSYHLDR